MATHQACTWALSVLPDSAAGKAILASDIQRAQGKQDAVDYITAVDAFEKFFAAVADYDNKTQQLLAAFLFARVHHNEQFYQWLNGKKVPYAFHCARAAWFAHQISRDALAVLHALWHDLLEDKRVSIEEVRAELVQYSFVSDKDAVIVALHLLDRNAYAGSTKTTDYYAGICKHPYALLAKCADLLANLEASCIRFDEMKRNSSRFWIYAYFWEIEQYIFPDSFFQQARLSSLLKKELSAAIAAVKAKFGQNELQECARYAEEHHD